MNFRQLKEFIKNPEIYKFLSVGIVGAILVFFFTIVFTSVLGIFYVISTAIAFEISILWGFFTNDRWTFSKVRKKHRPYIRFLKYNLFSLIALGIIQIVMISFVTTFDLHYSLSQAIGIAVAFIFNFSMSKKISFT